MEMVGPPGLEPGTKGLWGPVKSITCWLCWNRGSSVQLVIIVLIQ